MSEKRFSNSTPRIPDQVVKITFPADHVLHIAMNRPKQYNAMNTAMEGCLNDLLEWFEREPWLYVAIIGSTSKKAWCAGQDLKELGERSKSTSTPNIEKTRHGFGGISTRFTK